MIKAANAESKQTFTKKWQKYIEITKNGLKIIFPQDKLLLIATGISEGNIQIGEGIDEISPNNLPPPEPAPMPAQSQIPTSPNKLIKEPKVSNGMKIALTFDDGPSEYTYRILETLAKNDTKATFCVLGMNIKGREDIIKQATDQGCEVFGHSWSHNSLNKSSYNALKEELQNTNDAISSITGLKPKWFRPPYGATNQNLKDAAKDLEMGILLWNVDPEDWKTKDAEATYNAVMSNIGDGCIVLAHDIYEQTAEAFERIIPELANMGYELVTVSELFSDVPAGNVVP